MPSLVAQDRDIIAERYIRSLGGITLSLPLWKRDGTEFIDESPYGHLCTVTGALWGTQGRFFDGADDVIDCGGDASIAAITGDLTLEVWWKPLDVTSAQTIISTRQGKNDSTVPYHLFYAG